MGGPEMVVVPDINGYIWITVYYSMDHYEHLWIIMNTAIVYKSTVRRLPSHHDGKAMTTSRLDVLIISLITGSIKSVLRQ